MPSFLCNKWLTTALLLTLPMAHATTNTAPALLPEEQVYVATSQTTQAVAEPYFLAYIARDWGALESLLHPDARWHDPTAEQLFSQAPTQGRVNTLKHLRRAFAGIVDMQAQVQRRMFSSHYAVYVVALDWTVLLQDGQRMEIAGTPLVVTLRIRDGKVYSHTDYADYHPFITTYQQHRKP